MQIARIIGLLTFFLLSTSILNAQTAPVCPAAVLLDLARAASTCYELGREDICSGNGAVTATTFDGTAGVAQPGDQSPASSVAQLSVVSNPDEVGIALLSLRANLPTLTERSLFVLVFGDVELVNQVGPLPQLTAIATGAANIRSAPRSDADIIGQAAVTNGLILNGRTTDGRWLRAQVRNTDAYGWVSADVLNIQGDANQLAVVDEHSVVQRAFEAMTLVIEDTAFCDGALAAGVLIQSPGVDDSATVTINATGFSLAGTAYITGHETLEFYILQGHALVDEIFVPAGAWATPGQAAAPFDSAVFSALPLHLLPVSVRLPAPITAADILSLKADYEAAQMVATPAPLPTIDPTICRRATRRTTTLYAGPGDFYEAINELPARRPVEPRLQTTDPDGRPWWQLRNSNWILVADVRETGECAAIPRTQVVSAPRNNTLSLETCETTNGPLRSGQRVTIQFTPPAYDNWGEAREAVRIDPGRISINARTYRTRATDPIQIGTAGVDDRYLRRFYINWTAEPGTFRIAGDRLSYEPICALTVPVE